MTYPKLKPCPECGSETMLEIYTYESGWRRVECDACMYFGPGEGNILLAIRGWNNRAKPIHVTPLGPDGERVI